MCRINILGQTIKIYKEYFAFPILKTNTVIKCRDSQCGTSKYNFNRKEYIVKTDMSCDIKNVLYVITCQDWNEYMYYIGKTSNRLRARVPVNKQHENTPEYRQIPLSEHLEICGNKQFNIFPFCKLMRDSAVKRRKKKSLYPYLIPN